MLYFLILSEMSNWPSSPYFPLILPKAYSIDSLFSSYSFIEATNPRIGNFLSSPQASIYAWMFMIPYLNNGNAGGSFKLLVEMH